MRTLAPIVYFAYNRPEHTRRTLKALSNNKLSADSDLWIYIDGPKENATAENIQNINEVKKIVREKQWCKNVNIVESEKNRGLFKAITEGITTIVNQFGKIIIVEDDVLVSKGFLEYMNDALDFYENNPRVMHISAFSPAKFNGLIIKEPTYFFNHTHCWGWGTWKRAWDFFIADQNVLRRQVKEKGKSIYNLNMDGTFEFYWGLKAIAHGKFQDWNFNWHTSVFLQDGLCLHPTHSLVSNIGHDGSGTNCTDVDYFSTDLPLAEKIDVTAIPLIENKEARRVNKKSLSAKYKTTFFVKHYLRYLIK